jgi:hypothetical protein
VAAGEVQGPQDGNAGNSCELKRNIFFLAPDVVDFRR